MRGVEPCFKVFILESRFLDAALQFIHTRSVGFVAAGFACKC